MEGIHMLNLKDINWKKPGLFAAGVAFGTAGIKILTRMMQRNYIQTVQQPY